MVFQRTRRPRIRSGRSLSSLGSPLDVRPLDGARAFVCCDRSVFSCPPRFP
jgi:hypothetical protein